MWIEPDKISDLRSRLVEALGRATCLAQNFEHNCKYVLMIYEMGHKADDVGYATSEEMWSHSARLHKRALHKTIETAAGNFRVSSEEIALLFDAKNSRNYLAHSAGIHLIHLPARDFASELQTFCDHIHVLAVADNLVASWSFSIQEKHVPPTHRTADYPQKIVDWILHPIESLILKSQQTAAPKQ